MNLALLNGYIQWDFQLENEFVNPHRQSGYTFVIDQYEAEPQLALYRIGPYSSHTDPLERQPPRELLAKALQELHVSPEADGIYRINQELRSWIEQNLLK